MCLETHFWEEYTDTHTRTHSENHISASEALKTPTSLERERKEEEKKVAKGTSMSYVTTFMHYSEMFPTRQF